MSAAPWPDYCKKETLAKRLNLAVGAVDQLVQRGLLPPPIVVGDAKLWRWADVDAWLSQQQNERLVAVEDPYLSGVSRAREAAPACPPGAQLDRSRVLLPDASSRNRKAG